MGQGALSRPVAQWWLSLNSSRSTPAGIAVSSAVRRERRPCLHQISVERETTITRTTQSKMKMPALVAPSSETAGARRATATRSDENGDARPTSIVALAATHDKRRDAK